MDRLTAMSSFVAVVENSGFSAAARKLDIATSVVTTHIKSLEDMLGVRLLNRSTRRVSATEIGRAYYERCVQILSDIEEADGAAQESQATVRGVLRVNIALALPVILAPVFAQYIKLYPEMSVNVIASGRMGDLIEEGYDVALRIAPVEDTSLIVRRLVPYHIVVCASPAYLARHGRPETPEDLKKHNCLLFTDAALKRRWRFAGAGDEGIELAGNLQTNNVETLRTAAVLGQGLVAAPCFMVAPELRSGQLVPVLTEFSSGDHSIDALYPHRKHLPGKVRTFIDLAARHLREAMPHAPSAPPQPFGVVEQIRKPIAFGHGVVSLR